MSPPLNPGHFPCRFVLRPDCRVSWISLFPLCTNPVAIRPENVPLESNKGMKVRLRSLLCKQNRERNVNGRILVKIGGGEGHMEFIDIVTLIVVYV